jgi:hypothetical protein
MASRPVVRRAQERERAPPRGPLNDGVRSRPRGGGGGRGGRDLLSGVGTLKSAPSIRPQPRRANYTLVQTTVGGAISGLIPSVSCQRCSPNAPFAKLECLMAE